MKKAAASGTHGIVFHRSPRESAPVLFIFKAMRALKADTAHTLYVGDSDVDVQTAHNAGLTCVAVSWGFRSREVLAAAGADIIIDEAERLEDAIGALAES